MTIRTAMLCDHCDAVFALDVPSGYGGLAASAHEAGWTSARQDGTWINQCPDHDETAAPAAESR